MSYEPDAKVRYYHVKCWQPAQGERKWGRHLDFGVVASSAVNAMHVVSTYHPECRIDAVIDRGIVHHVLDTPEPSTVTGK